MSFSRQTFVNFVITLLISISLSLFLSDYNITQDSRLNACSTLIQPHAIQHSSILSIVQSCSSLSPIPSCSTSGCPTFWSRPSLTNLARDAPLSKPEQECVQPCSVKPCLILSLSSGLYSNLNHIFCCFTVCMDRVIRLKRKNMQRNTTAKMLHLKNHQINRLLSILQINKIYENQELFSVDILIQH